MSEIIESTQYIELLLGYIKEINKEGIPEEEKKQLLSEINEEIIEDALVSSLHFHSLFKEFQQRKEEIIKEEIKKRNKILFKVIQEEKKKKEEETKGKVGKEKEYVEQEYYKRIHELESVINLKEY